MLAQSGIVAAVEKLRVQPHGTGILDRGLPTALAVRDPYRLVDAQERAGWKAQGVWRGLVAVTVHTSDRIKSAGFSPSQSTEL